MGIEVSIAKVAIVGPENGMPPGDAVNLIRTTFSARVMTPVEALAQYRASRDSLSVLLVHSMNEKDAREFLTEVRDGRMQALRVLLWSNDPKVAALASEDVFDIQGVVPLDTEFLEIARLINLAQEASAALKSSFPISEFYLDNSFHDVIEWFEKTRWEWSDLPDLGSIDRSLLTEQDMAALREGAIIEFGTLPGADNFLREWHDEFGFSSWALQWGGEEARHSLIQARYLKAIGFNIRSSHAMLKRKPYPMGNKRAGTLMMNIISEYRAAHYYSQHANRSNEPVLKAIWRLLSKDEARHAKAFGTFCQELCALSEEEMVAALKMAYVWLADRSHGVKHPAGHFYKFSSSEAGIKEIESQVDSATGQADGNVYRVIQRLTGDSTIVDPRTLRRSIRERL
jgi:hypothetical protein